MVHMPHWPLYFGPDPDITRSLIRVKKVLGLLGNPEKKLQNVIHITGTKGKGSTALFVAKILKELSYSVNLYTSPHIYESNERFLINNVKISDRDLYFYTEKIRLTVMKYYPELEHEFTSFDIMTITAVDKFASTMADFNIFEVGMGGLLDATNVFEVNKPKAYVFTPIHLDHKIFLGEHPLQVAANKCGILKPDAENVIISQQSEDVSLYIKKVANDMGAKNVFIYSEDFEAFKLEGLLDKFAFESKYLSMMLNKPSLTGDHQLVNLATAIQVVLTFKLTLTEDAVNNATQNVIHYSRMQKINKNNNFQCEIPENFNLYVDGAHNALSAEVVNRFVEQYCVEKNAKAYIVLARSKNASNVDMLSVFKKNKYVEKFFAIRAIEPMPEPPQRIQLAAESLLMNLEIKDSPESCLLDILMLDPSSNSLVVFCGSLYLGRFFK